MKRIFTSQTYFILGIVTLVVAVITSAGANNNSVGEALAGISLGIVAGAFVLGAALFASRDR